MPDFMSSYAIDPHVEVLSSRDKRPVGATAHATMLNSSHVRFHESRIVLEPMRRAISMVEQRSPPNGPVSNGTSRLTVDGVEGIPEDDRRWLFGRSLSAGE